MDLIYFLFFVLFLFCCWLFFHDWFIIVVSDSSFLVCFVYFSQASFIVCFVKLFQKWGFSSLHFGFPRKRESGLTSITLYRVYPMLYITIRLLDQFHHFSLLICYLSFIYTKTKWVKKLSSLDWKLKWHFYRLKKSCSN